MLMFCHVFKRREKGSPITLLNYLSCLTTKPFHIIIPVFDDTFLKAILKTEKKFISFSVFNVFFHRLIAFYKGHFNTRKGIVLWNNRLFSSLFLCSFVFD